MKRTMIDIPVFFALIGCLLSMSAGCQSSGSAQPKNPFAVDRQTVPPPATFSHQSFYLGQTPVSSQTPATNYTPSSPATIPTDVPLPAGSVPSPSGTGYGSLNAPGATTFRTSAILPPTAADQGWNASTGEATPQAVPADASSQIAASYTPETAERNLDTRIGTQGVVLAGGETRIAPTNTDSLVVSSSQTFTQIVDDQDPGPVFSEPKTNYAGKYQ